MTESEKAKGYQLVWVSPEELIAGNQNFLQEAWIYRDTEVIKKLLD